MRSMIDRALRNQINEIKRLRDEEELPWHQIAEKTGVPETTARRRYRAGSLAEAAEEIVEQPLKDFPPIEPLNIKVKSAYLKSDKVPLERFKPLERKGDAIVTCDWHIPLHDPDLINVMIEYAKRKKIKSLIIAGDYFNMDSFSSYLPHQPEAAFDVERYDGNLIMKTLLKTFDSVDFFWGNHDFRLAKKLGFTKSFTECMKWCLSELTDEEFSKIRFSDLDYMHYRPGDGRVYRICHPENFSEVPLAVGRKLAIKHGCSVITAHSHHFGIGAATNGRDIVIEGGGFFNKDRTEYIQRSNTHHEWVTGFTSFKEGIPELVGPVFGNDVQYRKEVIKK